MLQPLQIPHVETAASREGFSSGDRVRRAGGQPVTLPPDGIVQEWATLEYDSTAWRCIVTWGGRYIGRFEAHEIEHDNLPQ